MNPGKYDRQITIKQRIIGNNLYNEEKILGYENITFDPVVWASKNPRLGNEKMITDQIVSENVVRWVIRYRTDLNSEMVIEEDGQIYEITSMAEATGKMFGRREALEIKTILKDNQ